MEENVIPIKTTIMINADASVRDIYVKKKRYLESCYMELRKW